MTWLKAIVREVFGLFVDDGYLAIATLAWLVAAWLAVRAGHGDWQGWCLFAGLAAILVASVLRATRRR